MCIDQELNFKGRPSVGDFLVIIYKTYLNVMFTSGIEESSPDFMLPVYLTISNLVFWLTCL